MALPHFSVVGLTSLFCVATLAGCGSHGGDLEITNDSNVRVTVSTGGDPITVEPGGGVVVLDSGCTAGDVTIVLDKSKQLTVPGPVCPPDTIVIHADTAEVVEAP